MRGIFRTLTAVLSLVTVLSVLSVPALADSYDRFADAGQQTHEVRSTSTPIILDGKISEGEWNADAIEVKVGDPGVMWLDWTVEESFPQDELSEIIPWHIRYYVTYNAEGLYVGAEITEPTHYCPDDSVDNLWTHDCLEVDVSLDPYGDIENEEIDFTEDNMLDRVRNAYALVDNGEDDPYSVGYCYTASTYGLYTVSTTPMDSDYYCIAREEQVTTYEIFFPWIDLWIEEKAPSEVYINFQLHIADNRYTEYCMEGYNSCLGGIRYALMLDAEQRDEYHTSKSMILHIFKLTDFAAVNGESGETGTETDTTPVAEIDTAAGTEANTDLETNGTETAAQTDKSADPSTDTAADPAGGTSSGGCSSTLGLSAALLLTAAAAWAFRKRKE